MAKKRAKKSLNHGGDRGKWDKIIQSSGSTKGDVLELFFSDILMRLPTKSIVYCKSVCKKWYNHISSPEFTRFHSERIKPQFLVRTLDSTRISRTLHLVEPEQHSRGFDLDECYCLCRSKDAQTCHIELNSVMKIPLHNADRVLLSADRDKRTRANLPRKNHKFNVANSCRGLLCLCENSRNDPVSVCNPVTGEFLNLPQTRSEFDYTGSIDSGIGFSPKSNQYKVIGVFTLDMPVEYFIKVRESGGQYVSTFAEVHTLGTDSWRSVVGAPYSYRKLAFPTYLDGALYCLSERSRNSDGIVSFDFDTERFETVPMPYLRKITTRHITLGVLTGKLYVCDASDLECIDIWVMNDSVGGGRKSWTQMFAIRESCDEWSYGLCQPLNYFDNGALLVFRNYTSGMMYSSQEVFESKHPNYTIGTHKYLQLNGLKSRYEVIAYTPSFVPLKDIVAAEHVKVLNVISRCGSLKLPGETKPLYLKGDSIMSSYIFTEDYDVEEDYWTKHFWNKY